jgi:uncharacterized protein YceH (UPF0502 family)
MEEKVGKHYSAFVSDTSQVKRALREAGVKDNDAIEQIAGAVAGMDGALSITVVEYDDETTYAISHQQADFGPAAQAVHNFEADAKIAALEQQVAALLARLDD